MFSDYNFLDNSSCANYTTAVIKTDGSLWMWGNNNFGQLGNGGEVNTVIEDGPRVYRNQNTPIMVMDDVVAVSCEYSFTAAIKTDGSLWMWGANDYGQLGNGGTGNAIGNWEPSDKNYDKPIQTTPIKVMDDVVSITCAVNYTAAIKTDGSLWMWGNGYGNSPVKVMDGVVSVVLRQDDYAIKTDNSLWKIELGGNHTKVMDNVAAVSKNAGIVLKTDSSLWTLTYDEKYEKIANNVVAFNGGYYLKSDGTLWEWSTTGQAEKILNGVGVPLEDAALTTDGTLWIWGNNQNGQVGNDTYETINVEVKTPYQIASISFPKDVRIHYTDGGLNMLFLLVPALAVVVVLAVVAVIVLLKRKKRRAPVVGLAVVPIGGQTPPSAPVPAPIFEEVPAAKPVPAPAVEEVVDQKADTQIPDIQFCPYCGSKMALGFKFCPKCGRELPNGEG